MTQINILYTWTKWFCIIHTRVSYFTWSHCEILFILHEFKIVKEFVKIQLYLKFIWNCVIPKRYLFHKKMSKNFFSSDFPRRVLAQSISVLIAQKTKKTRSMQERNVAIQFFCKVYVKHTTYVCISQFFLDKRYQCF